MQNKILFEWYSLKWDIWKHFPRFVKRSFRHKLLLIILLYLSKWNIGNILCSTFWWTSRSSAIWSCDWYSFKNWIYWLELQFHIKLLNCISILLLKHETQLSYMLEEHIPLSNPENYPIYVLNEFPGKIFNDYPLTNFSSTQAIWWHRCWWRMLETNVLVTSLRCWWLI